MNLPPDRVPQGLTEKEYRRLHTLYSLMGRMDNAVESLNYANDLSEKECKDGMGSEDIDPFQQGMRLGEKFVGQLMRLAGKAAEGQGEKDAGKELETFLAETEDELKKLGMTHEQIEQMSSQIHSALAQVAAPAEPPPREVPDGLSAERYYHLGMEYKALGWTEQSRDALTMASELNDKQWSPRAITFLRTKLPHHPVPLYAEQANIQAFNFMVSGRKAEAYEAFFTLMRDYPEFEWPYGNTGSMYIADGKLQEAKDLLRKALAINPYYVNAWHHLFRAHLLSSEFEESRHCLEEIRKIDLDDERLPMIQQMLSEVESWSD